VTICRWRVGTVCSTACLHNHGLPRNRARGAVLHQPPIELINVYILSRSGGQETR
jgi:hypothetical protein